MPQLHDSIAAGYKIIHDANLQNLAEIIGCRLSNANKVLQTNLALATIIKPHILVGRQQAINTLRIKTCEHWE